MNQDVQALTPKLLNIEELATLLQVPRSWIYEHTRTSKTSGFPVIRVGKYLRFEYQKVLDFLKQN
jgi:predicted DNA-binding transcriptional regulator AlpA